QDTGLAAPAASAAPDSKSSPTLNAPSTQSRRSDLGLFRLIPAFFLPPPNCERPARRTCGGGALQDDCPSSRDYLQGRLQQAGLAARRRPADRVAQQLRVRDPARRVRVNRPVEGLRRPRRI